MQQTQSGIGGNRISSYPLSFTAGALLIEESREVASALLRTETLAEAKADIISGGILQSRTEAAGKRILSELMFRLGHLHQSDLEIVAHGDAETVRQFLWINNCFRYPLIREFAEGPLLDARSQSGAALDINQIDAFILSRAQEQPNLEATSSSTKGKLRQVLGLMMIQAGLINANKQLLRGAISPDLKWIFEANPEALNWTGGLKLL